MKTINFTIIYGKFWHLFQNTTKFILGIMNIHAGILGIFHKNQISVRQHTPFSNPPPYIGECTVLQYLSITFYVP